MCFTPSNSHLLTLAKDSSSKERQEDAGGGWEFIYVCTRLLIYLCDFNFVIVDSCLLLSGVTSQVLNAVPLGNCVTVIVSWFRSIWKSQCHIRDGNQEEHNRGLSLLSTYLRVTDDIHSTAHRVDRSFEVGKCYQCNRSKSTVYVSLSRLHPTGVKKVSLIFIQDSAVPLRIEIIALSSIDSQWLSH